MPGPAGSRDGSGGGFGFTIREAVAFLTSPVSANCIAARTASKVQPAWHFTTTGRRVPALRLRDGSRSSWAGQRDCQPEVVCFGAQLRASRRFSQSWRVGALTLSVLSALYPYVTSAGVRIGRG